MYEKPQYLTPNGYKRTSANPYGKDVNVLAMLRAQQAALLKKKAEQEQSAIGDTGAAPTRLLRPRAPKKGIDEKSARLIAEAIKSMLRSK